MTPIEYLDQQVRAACQNATGVSIGRWTDKRTWRANPPTLDKTEQAAAQAIFDAFDKAAFESTQAPIKTIEDRLAALESKTGA